MRAVLYARFSTDLQNPGSIADQLAACRRHAAQIGATIVGEFHDAAISGASMVNRPGLSAMLTAAKAGAVDVVIAEALDRLTRSGGDAWDIFDDLERQGVRISTISEGEVGDMAIGFAGTMNAVFRRENGRKVRRGLAGVIASGRLASKPPFGYRARREYDAAGEPIRGLVEINPVTAPTVARVAAEYAAGASGQSIAMRLNAERIPAPAGGTWHANAIIGDARRLQGVLRNPIYAGEIVWNRATHPKDRRTGKPLTRQNPATDLVRQPAPELRIVPQAVWEAVQMRLAEQAARVAAHGNPSAANMPRRIFSGILKCGICGSALVTSGPNRRYRCRARRDKGPMACSNSVTAPAETLEGEVLAMLRTDLLHPDVVEAVVQEFRQAQAARLSAARSSRATIERELGDIGRRADRLVDQVADGVLTGRSIKAKLDELETRRSQLEAELELSNVSAEVVTLHPHVATRYRQLVEDLQTRLSGDGSAEHEATRATLRQVIREIRYFPAASRGKWRLEIDGDLTNLFRRAGATGPARAIARGRT